MFHALEVQGGAKYPPYFQQGIVKGGEAVEGWGWAGEVQVVVKFPLQHSAVVNTVWSNEQRTFAVETYFSQSHSIVAVWRAFRTRYQIPPLGTEYRTEKPFCCGLRTSEKREVCLKKDGDDHGPLEHQRTSRLSDGPFCSLPGALHANNGHHLQDVLFKTM